MTDENMLIVRIGEAERARILAEDFIAKINARLEQLYPPEFRAVLAEWQARVAEAGPRPDFFQWLAQQTGGKSYEPPRVLAFSADVPPDDPSAPCLGSCQVI